ncbi:MAG: hypothetical protein KIT60_06855 [Burkholderiaceae bacterium]|nr:hypothetical protein [Burkholderiaceae bacterium]
MTEATVTATEEIIDSAKGLADARAHLSTLVLALNEHVEAAKADAMPAIREAIAWATAAWRELELRVREHPELFVKPRSLEAHGIRFGWQKGKGGLQIDDPERTVKLIHRHLADMVDVLIATKEAPVKDALAQLSAVELKRIGVELKDTGDAVFIKPAESTLDKLVKALVSGQAEGVE